MFKTDVKSYFASIDTVILEKIVNCIFLPDPPSLPLRYLVWQNLFEPLELRDRKFREKGIFQGSSLSSYYAWVYLKKLDDFFEDFEGEKVFYQRYKDDIIVLTKSDDELNRMRNIIYSILRKRKLKN